MIVMRGQAALSSPIHSIMLLTSALILLGPGCKKATKSSDDKAGSAVTQNTATAATKPSNTSKQAPSATPSGTEGPVPGQPKPAQPETVAKQGQAEQPASAQLADAGSAPNATQDAGPTADTDAVGSKDADTAAEAADVDAGVDTADNGDSETASTEDTPADSQDSNEEETSADQPSEEKEGSGEKEESEEKEDSGEKDSGDETDEPEGDPGEASTSSKDDTSGAPIGAEPIAPQVDDQGREIVVAEDGSQAVVVDPDPETGALSDTQRLQMVLLCGQLACLHELNGDMPRDQATRLLQTQLGFEQEAYNQHLAGVFSDPTTGGACDGLRTLCAEDADSDNPTGQLSKVQRTLLNALVALVNGPKAGQPTPSVDNATMLAAMKELQSNPLFAREFLNASWQYVRAQMPTPTPPPGPAVPRAPVPPRTDKKSDKIAPKTHRFVGSLRDDQSKKVGSIRFRVRNGRFTHGTLSYDGNTYVLPTSEQEEDGQFSLHAKSKAGFIRLKGVWNPDSSWMRGSYSGFVNRKRVQGVFSLAAH
jgi:hypothetical protein